MNPTLNRTRHGSHTSVGGDCVTHPSTSVIVTPPVSSPTKVESSSVTTHCDERGDSMVPQISVPDLWSRGPNRPSSLNQGRGRLEAGLSYFSINSTLGPLDLIEDKRLWSKGVANSFPSSPNLVTKDVKKKDDSLSREINSLHNTPWDYTVYRGVTRRRLTPSPDLW